MSLPICRFNVYGRYMLEIERIGGNWIITKQIGERRAIVHDFAIPSFITDCDKIAVFLDDMLHESSAPGDAILKL